LGAGARGSQRGEESATLVRRQPTNDTESGRAIETQSDPTLDAAQAAPAAAANNQRTVA
jgi:hypothetical protein